MTNKYPIVVAKNPLKITYLNSMDISERFSKLQAKEEVYILASKDDLEDLSASELIAVYNKQEEKPVKRFSARTIGEQRVWKSLEAHRPQVAPAPVITKKPFLQSKPKTSLPKKSNGYNTEPRDKVTIQPCRKGTKQAALVDALFKGANMEKLMDVTSGGRKPWQKVTVLSGLSWDVHSVKGYGVRSEGSGEDRTFHLVLPEGMKAPLAHV